MIKYLVAVMMLLLSVFLLIFGSKFSVSENLENKLRGEEKWQQAMTDQPDYLFWFLQISDIHLSKFVDPTRVGDFRTFCDSVIDTIKPRVVIASGDLTDAKDRLLGSQQYAEEWKAYYTTLLETGIFNKTSWLDIRGNHDNFNVQFLYSYTDLFRNYSAQGRHHKKSYLHQENVDGIKYNFMALDASIEPGSKRPYNFIGMMQDSELNRVETMLKKSPSDYIIWFAHYPTSTILTPPDFDPIRKFIGNFDASSIFVAGHLHTLGNLVFRMYTLQPEGFLELELGDFLRNRLFRLAVYDHGLFSFTDVKLGTWPIAIITNPKDVFFNNPFKEDISLQRGSTHVRILAFSTSEITTCRIKFNDGDWMKCTRKTESFFVVPWNPSSFSKGKHRIELFIGDAAGRVTLKEQFFALDGTRVKFDFLARFVLMSDITTVFQVGFFIAFVICLFPLFVFKTWQLLIKCECQLWGHVDCEIIFLVLIAAGKLNRPKISSPYWRSVVEKYLILASIDRLYFGLLFWLLYTAIGPWSFHEILDKVHGIIFVWGTFVKGEFVPGTLSWWYGFHQLMFFQLPLTIILAGVLRRRFKKFLKKSQEDVTTQREDTFWQGIGKNLAFTAVMIAEMLLAIFYLIQNGVFAFIIAPMRVWGMVLAFVLFYQAHCKITDEEFNRSSLACSPDVKFATS